MLKLKNYIKRYAFLYKITLKLYTNIRKFIFVRVFIRYKFAMSYYKNKIRLILKWSIKKTENDNFYYDLEEKNLEDLISMISLITNIKIQDIETYASEIRNNFQIKEHISSYFRKTRSLRDIEVDFGRRVGW